MIYWLGKGTQQTGPFSREQIDAMQADGALSNEMLYWAEGMPAWRPLCELVPQPDLKAGVPSVVQTNSREIAFFPVSTLKFVLMTLFTLGIYEVYWFYKNFSYLRHQREDGSMPFWRAVFSIFFCYGLFASIKTKCEERGVTCSFKPGMTAVVYILVGITWKLPESWWMISLFSFLPLIPAQKAIQALNDQNAPRDELNERFSTGNIVAMVFGGILLALCILGLFLPPNQ